MVNKYKYSIDGGVLTFIESVDKDKAESAKSLYGDTAKLLADYKAGELFVEIEPQPNEVALLFLEIEELLKLSNVKALVNAEFIDHDNMDEIIEKLGGDSVKMKSPEGEIVLVHVTKITDYLKVGYIHHRKEYREYPLVVDPSTYKILFTCEWAEVKRYTDDNKLVIIPKL